MSNSETKSGYWKPDSASSKCDSDECKTEFSFFDRKHHCRWCGGIFCSACLKKPAIFDGKKMYAPVCDDCHADNYRHQCCLCGSILHLLCVTTCSMCKKEFCRTCCIKSSDGTLVQCKECHQRDCSASKISRSFRMYQAKKEFDLLKKQYISDPEMQKRILRDDYLYRLSRKDIEALMQKKSQPPLSAKEIEELKKKRILTGISVKGARQYTKDPSTGKMHLDISRSSQFYYVGILNEIVRDFPGASVEFYYKQIADRFWMHSQNREGRCYGLSILWLRDKIANQDSRPFYLWISGQYDANAPLYSQLDALATIDAKQNSQKFAFEPGSDSLNSFLLKYERTQDVACLSEIKIKIDKIFRDIPGCQLGEFDPLAISGQFWVKNFAKEGEIPLLFAFSRQGPGRLHSRILLQTLLVDPQQRWLDYRKIPFYLGTIDLKQDKVRATYVGSLAKFLAQFIRHCYATYYDTGCHCAYVVFIQTHSHAFALYHDVDLRKGHFFDPNFGVICYPLNAAGIAEPALFTTMTSNFLKRYSNQSTEDDPSFLWLEVKRKAGSDTCG